ncbi:DUF4956 domain-containing protein [Clostridium lacusfryxellense]|uniref:DUF4956 domain-containing protein n=1 Tax=Clostridium lacusfryxellense TaxID=205328 RepID=UPI001C0C986C|nr:DUF4956 domain-containing protein [Clostridium lacusfryxellense]MBU3114089.1 DUF4956 domain-containing protein [Clostridium lacusfryxellense]
MKEQLLNYLVTNTGALTLEGVLFNFLMSVVLGAVIYISYRFSQTGAVYSARFNVSLVMLTLITTMVMNVIGNNIALSLGMVGALSIVRFRTAIKDPRDTAYIFWCIAVGICCGASEFMIAGVGSAVIFLFLLIFGLVKTNDRFLLVVRGTRECGEYIENTVSSQYNGKARLRVKNTSAQTVEYIFELSQVMIKAANKNEEPISDILYKKEGISNVNMVCQNDEINR